LYDTRVFEKKLQILISVLWKILHETGEKIKPAGQTLGDNINIMSNQSSFSKLQEATFGQVGVMLQ